MKQKLTLLLSLFVLLSSTFAQTSQPSKKDSRRLLGVHLDAMDVNTPQGWKDNTTTKSLSGLKNQDLGFSLSYWKLIRSKVDFSTKATMIFHNYSVVDRNVYSTSYNQLGLEIEPTLNVKAFEDNYTFNAFVTAGVGAGLYSNKFGAYVPAGLGLQANIGNSTYILLQSQYRFSLTNTVMKDNLFYSLGFLGNMADVKEKPVKLPTPPAILDRDDDGVADADDKCPDIKGVPALNGCPDADADGIADADDKCPSVAGVEKYQGCPVPDSDGDGVNDEMDKCPRDIGVAKYEGCPVPDTDKDGLNDDEDKCPAVAGPASNQGCPVIEKKIIEKVNFTARNIFFESLSSTLLDKSKKSLDEVVAILNADKLLMLSVEGHSDILGSVELNKKLSQERANSVKDYLISKGVDAKRLNAIGFGSANPIGDNKTPEGRAKNRRTELLLSNH